MAGPVDPIGPPAPADSRVAAEVMAAERSPGVQLARGARFAAHALPDGRVRVRLELGGRSFVEHIGSAESVRARIERDADPRDRAGLVAALRAGGGR